MKPSILGARGRTVGAVGFPLRPHRPFQVFMASSTGRRLKVRFLDGDGELSNWIDREEVDLFDSWRFLRTQLAPATVRLIEECLAGRGPVVRIRGDVLDEVFRHLPAESVHAALLSDAVPFAAGAKEGPRS